MKLVAIKAALNEAVACRLIPSLSIIDMFYKERSKSMTVVEHLKEGVIAPLGNGFFVFVDGGLYLVTCLHVIKRAARNKQPFRGG